MSQRNAQWIELDDQFRGRSDELALLTLGLAQLVTTFAFWLGVWPEAFGVRRATTLVVLLSVLFAAAGALGFYVAFQALCDEEMPGA